MPWRRRMLLIVLLVAAFTGIVVIYRSTILSSHVTHLGKRLYEVARRTLQCYVKSTNYTLLLVDLENDPRVQRTCGKHSVVYFKKHCAASLYLPETDWMLVLDADTVFQGVVNPNHCIEEWIDDTVDVILYERFFNWELAAGNYLVKNSRFGSEFLRDFAKYEFRLPDSWNGYDQGALMMLLIELLIPETIDAYHACEEYLVNATTYETYMATVVCARQALGARRVWPERVRIYRKFEAFARDGWATSEKWSEADFMIHGWKESRVEAFDGPFEEEVDLSVCGQDLRGWKWKKKKKKSIEEIREDIRSSEDFYRKEFPKEAKVQPFIDKLGVADCYPNCDPP